MMAPLAYVFWHWKADPIEAAAYEARARAFHASLEGRRPDGFLDSVCFSIPCAGWVPDGRAAYEDWYSIESSAVLDRLDHAAVSPPHQAPHDAIAREVSGGAGGLYRLRHGEPLDGGARFASWFHKPPGMAYDALYELLRPLTANGAALWGRQMVLGPAPEFCLHSREGVALPAPIEPTVIPLRPIWP
jgi:hypothetical protein